MQNSRSFLIACGVAYCLTLLPLCAADADVESKLREALRQKMHELDAQPARAVPQPAAAAPSPQKAPVPVAKPAPSARPIPPAQWTPAPAPRPTVAATPPKTTTAPAMTPAPKLAAPAPVDSEAIAKAREALRQKMNELDTQSAQAVPQPVVAVPPPEKAPVTVLKPAPSARPIPPAQWTPPPATHAAAPAKVQSPKAKSAPAAQATPPAGQPPTKEKAIKGGQPLPPLESVAPAVSADKEQRLKELLSKYKADQITPEEYHQQRAKILAEP